MRFLALTLVAAAAAALDTSTTPPFYSKSVKDAAGAVIDTAQVWQDGTNSRQSHAVAGGTVWLTLDEKGVIISVTNAAGTVFNYSRDEKGRIVNIVAGSEAWSIAYGPQDIAAVSGPNGAVDLSSQKALWRGMALVMAPKGQTQGATLVADPLVVGSLNVTPVPPAPAP